MDLPEQAKLARRATSRVFDLLGCGQVAYVDATPAQRFARNASSEARYSCVRPESDSARLTYHLSAAHELQQCMQALSDISGNGVGTAPGSAQTTPDSTETTSKTIQIIRLCEEARMLHLDAAAEYRDAGITPVYTNDDWEVKHLRTRRIGLHKRFSSPSVTRKAKEEVDDDETINFDQDDDQVDEFPEDTGESDSDSKEGTTEIPEELDEVEDDKDLEELPEELSTSTSSGLDLTFHTRIEPMKVTVSVDLPHELSLEEEQAEKLESDLETAFENALGSLLTTSTGKEVDSSTEEEEGLGEVPDEDKGHTDGNGDSNDDEDDEEEGSGNGGEHKPVSRPKNRLKPLNQARKKMRGNLRRSIPHPIVSKRARKSTRLVSRRRFLPGQVDSNTPKYLSRSRRQVMKTQEENLLWQLQQTPDDPLTWRVYADLLEENGSPNARAARGIADAIETGNLNEFERALWGMQSRFGVSEDNSWNATQSILMRAVNMFPALAQTQFFQQSQARRQQRENQAPNRVDNLRQNLNTYAHGAGIDLDWEVDYQDGLFTAGNSYHAMDNNGSYAGWVSFTVAIPASHPMDFVVEVEQDDIDSIMEQYEVEEEEGTTIEDVEINPEYPDEWVGAISAADIDEEGVGRIISEGEPFTEEILQQLIDLDIRGVVISTEEDEEEDEGGGYEEESNAPYLDDLEGDLHQAIYGAIENFVAQEDLEPDVEGEEAEE